MGRVDVIPVDDHYGLRDFIEFPFRLYRDDPNWVAPLRSDLRRQLDPKRNPFFEHAEARLFLATSRGTAVGRISAHVDRNYNTFHSTPTQTDRTGFWGFFEVEDDPDTACALLDAASDWLESRGATSMMGPASFTLNDEAGLLIDGFHLPPVILMTYNPMYYEPLLDKADLLPVQDLYAYRLDATAEAPAETRRFAATVDADIIFRKIDLGDFDAEMDRFLAIYNDAWERNWGFVPVTEAELRDHARRLRPIIDPELVIIAERRGEPIAVSLTLPDVNEALIKAGGRLGLVSGARLLWKARRKKWSACRVFTLGVRKGFRRTGVGARLYVETLEAAKHNGYRWGEMSWILESNHEMNRAIHKMGGTRYKTYRMFERKVPGR